MWRKCSSLALLLLLSCLVRAAESRSTILSLLLEDKELSAADVLALRPFFEELQRQYDYLYSLSVQNDKQALPYALPTDPNYASDFDFDLRAQMASYTSLEPSIVYDTSLPTLEELIGKPTAEMTREQQLEFEDLESIMQDFLDEAQEGIDDLVRRALDLETRLLKLNKPKIIMAAINGLNVMWNYWGRGVRAAYCSYSHVPQMLVGLHAVNEGVDCYSYTMALILRIQDETVESVKTIKKNVYDLVNIYKKIAAKQTITGKILSATLNLFKALRRVHDIIAVGIDEYGKITNELPNAALKSAQCGTEFANSIPQMIETAQNLTACITYVETDKREYEFLKPEEDRYWNTGGEPEEIPHENEGDDDDDDDYEDRRSLLWNFKDDYADIR